jgi:1-acyl-sn-glycerol-3-phosphate acyltransferase
VARDAGQIQTLARAVLTPPFRFLWRITAEGMEHIPTSGGAIIAPNHISVLDSFFVPLVLPRRITYVGKAEYLDDWKTRWLFPAMGMIPIDRSGGDSSQRALDAAARILESGELFGIYPEGTRARDGLLHKGHTGMARLALRTNSPIVPVGIIGTDVVQSPDDRLPHPFRRVHLRFGRPIAVDRYVDRSGDRLLLRQITDEVMYEIRSLSGQTYVDTYAGKASAVAPAEPVVAAAGDGIAPVVALDDHRPGRAVSTGSEDGSVAASGNGSSTAIVVASAASNGAEAPVVEEADGVERRSSRSVLRSRPLDLDVELTSA